MAERLNAAVLKTVSGVTHSGVRIPLPPPFICRNSIVKRPHYRLTQVRVGTAPYSICGTIAGQPFEQFRATKKIVTQMPQTASEQT